MLEVTLFQPPGSINLIDSKSTCKNAPKFGYVTYTYMPNSGP